MSKNSFSFLLYNNCIRNKNKAIKLIDPKKDVQSYTKRLHIYDDYRKYRDTKYDFMIIPKEVDILNEYYSKGCGTNYSMCIQTRECDCGNMISHKINTIKPMLCIEVDWVNIFNLYNISQHINIWNYYFGFGLILQYKKSSSNNKLCNSKLYLHLVDVDTENVLPKQ